MVLGCNWVNIENASKCTFRISFSFPFFREWEEKDREELGDIYVYRGWEGGGEVRVQSSERNTFDWEPINVAE